MKGYRRVVLRTRTNQNKVLSTNLYRITVQRRRTNYVLRRKTNQNARIRNKKKKKNRRKHRKDDSSDPSSSDDSEFSDDSDYRRKQRKKKKHRKKNSIKQCATLTAKFPTTAYKSKIIRFKMDEDPLQRQIYFLTFVPLEMIFSKY